MRNMTTLRNCKCKTPNEKPQRRDTCVRCGCVIKEKWTSNDATVREFFDALADGMPGQGENLDRFRLECELREKQGRKLYGHRYLDRDNARDGLEEFADGAIYSFFTVLKERRDGRDEQWDLALTAAKHAYLAFAALAQMRQKEHGVAIPPTET